jgi:hypothetical protein
VAATARADSVAYLLNVTVRPGYNFANADDALAYGHGVCGPKWIAVHHRLPAMRRA